ncbi:hypothetical protein DFS34DRAFT_185690 [Phlyctochytrium arcticum]|nr:hypothetical protein DFS34DRAFT_185690 [Phlyctochytrium arcticum]
MLISFLFSCFPLGYGINPCSVICAFFLPISLSLFNLFSSLLVRYHADDLGIWQFHEFPCLSANFFSDKLISLYFLSFHLGMESFPPLQFSLYRRPFYWLYLAVQLSLCPLRGWRSSYLADFENVRAFRNFFPSC